MNMNVSGDYEKLMEDNIKDRLDWLEQEFELLFMQKKLRHCYTKEDILIGNQILEKIIENIHTSKNEELLNLLALTLNRIEQFYPEFF